MAIIMIHKNKVKLSTSEKWLWLWDWLPVISCEHKRNWKENFQESAMALKAFWKGLPAVKKLAQEAGVL